MAITNGYATLDQYDAKYGVTTSASDSLIETAIESASRMVDVHCGRRFYLDAEVSARTYSPTFDHYVDVDDIATTSGLVVATDEGDDGTFETTWTISTHFFVEPVNGKRGGIEGLPYDRIVSTGVRWFPTSGYRPSVQVTAQWGWAAVPVAVQEATLIKAAQFFRRKDQPDGVLGNGEFSALRVSRFEDPHFAALLAPYRKGGQAAGLVVA